jgi:hypothetical protein
VTSTCEDVATRRALIRAASRRAGHRRRAIPKSICAGNCSSWCQLHDRNRCRRVLAWNCVCRDLQRDAVPERGGEVNDPTGRFPGEARPKIGPKTLRLQEASRLLMAEGLDVAMASLRVGYESPAQFSANTAVCLAHRVHVTSPRRLPRGLPPGWTHVTRRGKTGRPGNRRCRRDHGGLCNRGRPPSGLSQLQPEIIESNLANALTM